MLAPCYKCADRHESCHSACERYAKFRGFTEQKRKERMDNAMVYDYRKRVVNRARFVKHMLADRT